MTLSSRTRNLIAAAALTMMGLAMARQQWSAFDRERQLDTGGMTVEGTVLDVRMDRYESVARVEYTPSGQPSRTREIAVSPPFANAPYHAREEKQITVRYLPHDDDVVHIAGASEASSWSMVFTAALFALAGWVMRLGLRAED